MRTKKQPPMVTKQCKVCSSDFQVSQYRVKYKHTCSKECRVKASAIGHSTGVTMVARDCPVCGVGFSVKKGQERNVQYCSASCGHKARAAMLTTKVTNTCTICLREFLCLRCKRGQKTCSIACGAESQRRTWATGVGLGDPRVTAAVAVRRANKKGAVPGWFNKAEAAAIYNEADRLRREHGSVVHVDHIVPLTSELVCGLHWAGNLRIMSGADNQAKGNRIWPDMP
jgi:hypothetical protein